MVLINQLCAIKSAPVLKSRPPSFAKMREFKKQWISKKLIRNRPVMPIITFLPIEELKKVVLLLIAIVIVCARIKQGKCIKQLVYNQAGTRIFAVFSAALREFPRYKAPYISLSAVIWKESKQARRQFS